MTPKFQAALAVLGDAHPVVRDLVRAERSRDALDELVVEAGLAQLPAQVQDAIDEIAEFLKTRDQSAALRVEASAAR
jgi:flagellar basal body-associated protein FliL